MAGDVGMHQDDTLASILDFGLLIREFAKRSAIESVALFPRY